MNNKHKCSLSKNDIGSCSFNSPTYMALETEGRRGGGQIHPQYIANKKLKG